MRIQHILLLAFATFILIRLVSISLYPLMDTTEARYGEIARIMVDSNNWLTPQFDYDVPFWGKPPMHTWASALSISLLDDSEFSLRLPHLITGLMTLLVVFLFAKKLGISALVTTFILLTSLGFYVASGMVMTDSLLTLSMTLAMVGFYLSWEHNKYWAYLGFLGVGLGLLTKGPIIIILVGIAIVPWLVINFGLSKGFKELLTRVPIVSGITIAFLIAAPWYFMAEKATPGFIDYFIIGEHWSRFVESGWEGDRYGDAHDEPRGIIWLYWVAVAFPWSFLLIHALFKRKWRECSVVDRPGSKKQLTTFLICWLISPMVLFTFAGNILPIYVLPGIPAMGLLLALWINEFSLKHLLTGSFTPLLLVMILVFSESTFRDRSDKWLLSEIDKDVPIYYLGKRSFSGRFYSQGQARLLRFKGVSTSNYYLVAGINASDNLSKLTTNCKKVKSNKRKVLMLCQS